jgi:Sporulation and spore germination
MQPKHKLIIAIACAVLVAAVAFQWLYWVREGTNSQQRGTVTAQKETIRLFSPLSTIKLGNRMLEIRSDMPDKEKADLILRELKKDKVISPGVQLRDLAIGLDGVLYLNLSRNLTEVHPGAPPEIIVVYSLVNSFALSFKDVRKVQLLLDGEPANTVGGVVYTYLPLEFNKDLMED